MSLFELETPDGYVAEEEGLIAAIRSNVETAADYLRERWDAFLNLSPTIIDLQHRAAIAAYNAQQRGDTQGYDNARAVIRSLGTLNIKHGQAVDTMQSVASYVGLGTYTGLGLVIPAAQITAITGLALLVVWFFRAYELEEQKLRLVEEGLATPQELAMLDPGPAPAMVLGEAAGLAKVLLAGLVVWVGWQALQTSGVLKKVGRRAKRNPPLVLFDSNPPGGVIGEETLAVYYEHAEDGEAYVHEFGPDVELIAEPDGSVRLEHRDGRELWDEFELEEED